MIRRYNKHGIRSLWKLVRPCHRGLYNHAIKNGDEVVRAFIALPLPSEIQQQIALAGEELKRSRAQIRRVAPHLMHITLKFLGEISSDQTGQITAALQTISSHPFRIEIGPIRGNKKRDPRVIWTVVSDEGQCRDLADQVDQLLEPLGFLPEKRAFQPHITVARVREQHPDLNQIIASLPQTRFCFCTIDRCILFRSDLHQDGPVYSELAGVRFE
ncbi:MAG: RNA 2',3'-cyclic phosphodiesterase [Methanospirillaceae archaeon]|nr:RNA 2',3'-cyclic phosphodiesterase [Methanospirillaceae archaeon]